MNLLLVHDGPIYFSNGFYYGLHLNNQTFERYNKFASRVTFLSFIEELASEPKLEVIDPKYQIIGIPRNVNKLSSIWKNKEIINSLIAKVDFTVCRVPSVLGFHVLKIIEQNQLPFLAEIVACPFDAYWNYNWKGKIYAPLAFIKAKIRINSIKHAVYVTQSFLQSRYPCRNRVVGISDIIRIQGTNKVLDNRLKLRLQQTRDSMPLTLGYVGSIDVPYKAHDNLLWAFEKLLSQGYELRLKLVGQGFGHQLKERIQRMGLREEVEVLGMIPHSQMSKFYQEIDLYVHPSKQEGLPRSMVEAMAQACPVIAAKTGGIPELIESKYLYPKGNRRALLKLLKETLVNREVEFPQMSKRNLEHIKNNYTDDILEPKRTAFFKEVFEYYGLSTEHFPSHQP